MPDPSGNVTSKSRGSPGTTAPSRGYVVATSGNPGSVMSASSNAVLEIRRPNSATPIESSSSGSAPKFSARNRRTSSRPSSSYEEFHGVCDRSVSLTVEASCAATVGTSNATRSARRHGSNTSLRIAGGVILSTVSGQGDDLLDAVDDGDGHQERADGEPQRAFARVERDPGAEQRAGHHADHE